ncbi:MAG TPA: hypothetical protein VF742_03230 [Terracidiphilus sp.]
MIFWRQFAVFVVVLGLLLSTACTKKKAQLAVNKTAPTLAVSVPDQIPEEALPPEPAAPQEATVEEPPAKKAPAKHRGAKKPAQTPAGNQANTTVAVNQPPPNPAGEPTDTAIAAEVSSQQLSEQKHSTALLLDSTEKELKALAQKGGLSHDEETIVKQIESYIKQSQNATLARDFERAYNLASKAHLLADALVKK